jgi:hypothetical protein
MFDGHAPPWSNLHSRRGAHLVGVKRERLLDGLNDPFNGPFTGLPAGGVAVSARTKNHLAGSVTLTNGITDAPPRERSYGRGVDAGIGPLGWRCRASAR